ncbi:Mucin and cadherin-like protein [Pteropus alecto]|uniref:Mucin and cadherin-like protein n=1 Tax=Pteropus alecto TaxID=9402 RepID=L5KPP1_PTEAL|nr:Mucin and cadherin-like protein [Pteropus alecto]
MAGRENTLLQAHLECVRGDTVVTQLRVFVSVLDVNDNPPVFPFEVKVEKVPEDTKVNTTVIPESELEAQDQDKDDTLFYTLQEVTPGASSFFSLVGVNRPALQLDQPLAFNRLPNMTFHLLVRVCKPLSPEADPQVPSERARPCSRADWGARPLQDTQEEDAVPSHTAQATLVLEVQPADLRPPWFLPCVYSDLYVCVQAQYYGAIPTGHKLPNPLILRPGPIYAVDGDTGINQRIIYSLMRGNEDGIFVIDADSGNLTMTKSVPSPKTFLLLVKGDQEDHARYSVTQVTVEAYNASESLPRFPASLYRGTVALGSALGTVVQDAAEPSLPLRVWAQDPEFPDLNSAITYRITNNSDFRMSGEAVLTAAPLTQLAVFYAEVEATNTVTSGTATTVVEIHVSEQEPTSTGTETTANTGSTAENNKPSISHAEDKRFSVVDMAALGGVLGALLLLALIALVTLIHKHYSSQFKCCSGKALSPAAAGDGDGPAGVRSILTKERRPEGGYKAVWFGEDIGAEADVVVLNTPASDTEGAGDEGSADEGSADEDAAAGPGGGPPDDAPGANSTYI